jgi:hypothetical protein
MYAKTGFWVFEFSWVDQKRKEARMTEDCAFSQDGHMVRVAAGSCSGLYKLLHSCCAGDDTAAAAAGVSCLSARTSCNSFFSLRLSSVKFS